MHEFVFWCVFIISVSWLGLLLIKVIYQDKSTNLFKITTGQLKTIIAIIIGPFSCAFVYILCPFNSLQSFILFGATSFIVSIITSPIHNYNFRITKAESNEFNMTKLELFFSLLSLLIPSTVIYTIFVLILKGFHSLW